MPAEYVSWNYNFANKNINSQLNQNLYQHLNRHHNHHYQSANKNSQYELQTLSVESLNDLKSKSYENNNNNTTTNNNNNNNETVLSRSKSSSYDKISKIKEYAFEDHHNYGYNNNNNNNNNNKQNYVSMPSIESSSSIHGNNTNNFSLFKKYWLLKNPYGMMRFDSVASSGYGSEFTIDSPIPSQPDTPLLELDYNHNSDNYDESDLIISPWSPTLDHSLSLDELSTSPTSLSTTTISPSSPLVEIMTHDHGRDHADVGRENFSQVKEKRKDYIRVVNRFGSELQDNCKFPLALPMDGSDVYKGASTWESISLLADCVLKSWEDSAANHSKVINRALSDNIKYVCPNSSLEGAIIQHPDCKLPFRRSKSELDLVQLGFKERKGLLPFGGDNGTYHYDHISNNNNNNMLMRKLSKDDINLNIHIDKKEGKKLMIKNSNNNNSNHNQHYLNPNPNPNPKPSRSRAFSTISVRKMSINGSNNLNSTSNNSHPVLTNSNSNFSNKSHKLSEKRKDKTDLNRTRSGSSVKSLNKRRSRAESLLFESTQQMHASKTNNQLHLLNYDAKQLVKTIKIDNPTSMAIQISKIERELFVNLPCDDVMQLVIKRGRSIANYYDYNNVLQSTIKLLIEFGKELSNFVIDIISREPNPEAKGKKIAAVIEVGCILRKLRNWQSLSSWIKGLQSPKIYSLGPAWLFTKNNYSVHFKDYIKLCKIVNQNEISILRSRQPCLPSLQSFINLLQVRCAATWDRLENMPRWTEAPTIIIWLEKELMIVNKSLKEKAREEIENEAIKLKQQQQQQSSLISYQARKYSRTAYDKCVATNEITLENYCLTFLPTNDPIYFIQNDQLPITWTSRSVRSIPAQYHGKIIRCFHNSYQLEINNLQKYTTNI